MGYIYRITNLISKKMYIGQTIRDPNARWCGHKNAIKAGKGCPILQKAVLKDGIKNFKFEVLIICFDEDLNIYEKEYIKKYNTLAPNGYNATEGGEPGGTFIGKKHSEETKKILSEKNRKYYENEENKQRVANLVKEGLKKSEKWKKAKDEGRIGIAGKQRIGGKLAEETKKKISESVKKYHEKNNSTTKINHKARMTSALGKRINQYSINNEFIKTYDGINETVRQTGISSGNIRSVLYNRTKTAGGFIWKYAE